MLYAHPHESTHLILPPIFHFPVSIHQDWGKDEKGRFMWVRVDHAREYFTIINIYAPNSSLE
eukprot:c33001_g1_i1 orf=34-219(+)